MDSEGLVVTVLPGVTSDGFLASSTSQNYEFIASPSAGKFFVVQDGEVVWEAEGTYPTMIAGTDDGIVYVGWMENGTSEGTLQAYNFLTGDLLWSYPCGFASYYLHLDADGNLIFSQQDWVGYMSYGPIRLVKLDKDTGEVIWSAYPDDGSGQLSWTSVSPLAVGQAGYYYAPTYSRELVKYGLDGEELWRAPLPTDSTGVFEANGYVFVSGILDPGYVSTITKIDATTGASLGVFEFDTTTLGLNPDYSAVWGMDVVAYGDAIYISGIAFSDAAVNPDAGNNEVFVVKLTAELTVEWTYLFGGNGDDLVGARGSSLSVQADGTFTLVTTSNNSTSVEGIPLETERNIVLYTFRDTPGVLNGTAAADKVIGSSGSDVIDTGGSADTVAGGAGTDTIIAGDGNDIVDAGFGNDLIVGGDGAGDDVYSGGSGTDTIRYSSALAGITVNLSLGTAGSTAGDDMAGIGSDTLSNIENVIAGYFGDQVIGNIAHNRLNGLSGNDVLSGGSGNDSLYGGADADTLSGGSGNDFLNGGQGKDRLTGGSGVDQFIFRSTSESSASAASADIITDFVRGTDKINLSAIDAFASTATNNAFVWRGTSSFSSTTAGEVRYKKYDNAGTSNDYTMVFIDNDADTTVEMSIRVNGLHNFTSSDFIL